MAIQVEYDPLADYQVQEKLLLRRDLLPANPKLKKQRRGTANERITR